MLCNTSWCEFRVCNCRVMSYNILEFACHARLFTFAYVMSFAYSIIFDACHRAQFSPHAHLIFVLSVIFVCPFVPLCVMFVQCACRCVFRCICMFVQCSWLCCRCHKQNHDRVSVVGVSLSSRCCVIFCVIIVCLPFVCDVCVLCDIGSCHVVCLAIFSVWCNFHVILVRTTI